MCGINDLTMQKKSKMGQMELFMEERTLFEQLCSLENLRKGFNSVKRNGGSPGIDGVTISEYASRLKEELSLLQIELESWEYKSKPVRRVEIPKPGKGSGVRILGVPGVSLLSYSA